MTWTYRPAELAATPLFQVRQYVGDTVAADPQLQDEEIAFLLSDENGNVLRAAIRGAEDLAARYARVVTVGKRMGSDLQEHYLKLATRLRRRLALSTMAPYAGGLSQAEKDTRRLNPDYVQPPFSEGMETEPGTEQNTPTPYNYPVPPVY